MSDEEYWFWLCGAEGIYAETIKRLLLKYESPRKVYEMSADYLSKEAGISKAQAQGLIKNKEAELFRKKYEKMKQAQIEFVWYESDRFPEKLKNIPNHPYCLYVRGKLPNENLPSCAIVGARACSEYGKKEAVRFSSHLAQSGIQIISGMASGIDSIAQKAALESGGKTFAVLGGGADVIYPAENTGLYWRIISEGGGIISEYPPGCAPLAWQFPHRNRIISGLSDKLLIIEARKRSGTLSTASHALDQGRDIYALPGRITDPLSVGCNELIYDGAGILLNPESIVKDFFTESETGLCRQSEGPVSEQFISEEGLEKYVSYHALKIDEIAEKADLSIEEAAIALAALELEGKVKEVGKDFYVRT